MASSRKAKKISQFTLTFSRLSRDVSRSHGSVDAQYGTAYRPLSFNPFDPFMQDLSTRTATHTRLEQGCLSHVIVKSRGDCEYRLLRNGLSGCLAATHV